MPSGATSTGFLPGQEAMQAMSVPVDTLLHWKEVIACGFINRTNTGNHPATGS